ncbi:MAG: DUF4114 domain-containing protein [Bacteroidetes bacterium]|nr:DUF4114 domain-containing protein [Bacteroidota bacterium]MBS1610576.1 DUF4114 domain-containing protein [Bacteroidota bacterium]
MKFTKPLFSLLGLAILMLGACKKEVKSRPVEFTETTYTNLGPYDNTGRPVDLLHDNISDTMKNFIAALLPEGIDLTKTHPEFFSSSAIADIAVKQTSDVYVTFVHERAGFDNALAFYTYPTTQPPTSAKDIKNIVYFFPHVGGVSPLIEGDKVKIGSFSPGTSIGFVLMQKAFDTTTTLLNNNAVHFCSNDVLNPEVDPAKKKHAVIINFAAENKVLVGFEDQDRTLPGTDNDFNDVIIYCTINPV